MPSTYDPVLRLELQATGENENTWGDKTNNNLELLGQAIAGHVSVAITGSGDVSLTASNAAEDEARYAFLTLSGTVTGNRNVIIPDASKIYVVRNNATIVGDYDVVFKTAAGAAVTVNPGLNFIACDGTDCWYVEDSNKLPLTGGTITGNLTVSGTLTGAASANVLKAGDTMTGDLTIQKASPTFSVLATSGDAGIEIGSAGGASFLDLKTPTSDDFDVRLSTAGTGGILYSPAGLTLQSGGSSDITYTAASGYHNFGAQTLIADAYLFSESSNDTGMYSSADGVILFKNNGTTYNSIATTGTYYQTLPANTWGLYQTQNNLDGSGNYIGYLLAGSAGGQIGSVKMVHVPGNWSGIRITNDTYNLNWDFRNNGTLYLPGGVSFLQNDGNMYMSWAGNYLNNVIFAYSDPSLKKNIKTAKRKAEPTLKALEFIEFDWDTATRKDLPKGNVPIGINAEQLREHYPELVRETPDGILHVPVPEFVMFLAKGLREAYDRIDTLEKRLTKLEAKQAKP